MTINKALLQQVLAKIEADPSTWRQSVWFCGTTACFAGHACLLSGDKPIVDHWVDDDGLEREMYMTDVDVGGSGVSADVQQRATELLGLTDEQADILFSGGNDLQDLREMVDGLVRNGEIPGKFYEEMY